MEKELLGFQTITKKVAQNIHEYLYSSIKLGDQEKATLIAGVLIALENESFRNTYRGMTDEDQFIDSFMSAVRYSILKYDGLKNGKEEVISVFDYIKHNSNFKNTVEQNGQRYIALQFLTEIIHKSVYNIAKTHPTYDILGEFYNEFTKYSGADQQSLGIVLTPHHIAEFMSELLEVNDNDVILDTCIGSASLALTAENSNIKENKVVGVEFNARMLSLAVANTMIRNIPSYLMLGDSWNPEIIEKINIQKPTKLIINPPYAQDGYPELGFVKRGLDSLQPGGLGVVILPIGTATKQDKKSKELRKELLESHTLLGSFSMPHELFYPVGTITIVLLFEAKIPHNNKNVFFGNLKEDGFIKDRTRGRVDENNKWLSIKEEMISLYNRKENYNNLSLLRSILTEEEQWCIESYLETNNNNLDDNTFIDKIKKYNIFLLNNNLQDEILKEPYSPNSIKLENFEWGSFLINDYFNSIKGRGGTQKSAKEKEGYNFYISATRENNGLSFLTGELTMHKGNVLTVSDFCDCFYQPKPFLGSHIVVLEPKFKMNTYQGLFIASVIELQKEKYSFGRSFSLTATKNEKISLPVDSNGNPDWQLMEDYIKTLPYSKYL